MPRQGRRLQHFPQAAGTTQSFTLSVQAYDASASITSANNITFLIGTSGSFTVTATGSPTPTLSESGTLPSGVTFNTSTGVLSGTAAPGTNRAYPITFTANNGNNTTQSFTLTVDTAGTVFYYLEDSLGTARVITTATGTVCYDADFYPFGGERAYTDTCDPAYKFTGKERDSESGLDDSGARYYSSQYGRFMTSDWSAGAEPVPYAKLDNPQSLNLYGYVLNNPLSRMDPGGHTDCGGNNAQGAGCKAIEKWDEDHDIRLAAQNKGNGIIPGTSQPAALQPPKPPADATQKTEYTTPDSAGKAAVERINPQSIKENKEYAGWTEKNPDGTYSVGSPRPGTEAGSDPGPRPDDAAGEYHTHGGPSPLYDGKHFSPQDKASASDVFRVPTEYLGTPSGRVLKYDTQTGNVSNLN